MDSVNCLGVWPVNLCSVAERRRELSYLIPYDAACIVLVIGTAKDNDSSSSNSNIKALDYEP